MVKVWTNGCFDILHKGHVELFKHAKSLGDHLMVGIDSDNKVRKMKGTGRPINSQKDRAAVLSAIKYIDEIVVFDTIGELSGRVKDYSPDILVVGSDWKGRDIIGAEHAQRIEFFQRIDGYSTTNILNNIK